MAMRKGVWTNDQCLDILQESPAPLEDLLDLLLIALRARFLICHRAAPGGLGTVGRRSPGRPIPHPDRLLGPLVRAGILGEPTLRVLGSGDRPGRLHVVICPLPSRTWPRAAAIAWTGACPQEAHRAAESTTRLLSWVALALDLAEARRGQPIGAGIPAPPRDAPAAAPDPKRPTVPVHPGHGSPAAGIIHHHPVPPHPSGRSNGKGELSLLGFPGIIASSQAMRDVLRTLTLVAPSDAAVLVEGESGTGKELIARALHQRSARAPGPFISENCAACPEGLLESEFFGVERGAFTGAVRSKPGLFERAHGGTLFLDEIGEMDLSLQRKLLRALQEREIRRVGGSASVPVDFRLVSATNRVLAEEIRSGRFREDLLYRIDVVTLRLPPLREHRDDIPLLIRHFLCRFAASALRPPPQLDPAALQLLCAYSWPGNVRELENEMCRAVALGLEAITPSTLSAKILRGAPREPPADDGSLLAPGRSLDQIERELIGGLIRKALRQTSGNKIQAARLLKIPKTSLYRRIRRYDLLDVLEVRSCKPAGEGPAPPAPND